MHKKNLVDIGIFIIVVSKSCIILKLLLFLSHKK